MKQLYILFSFLFIANMCIAQYATKQSAMNGSKEESTYVYKTPEKSHKNVIFSDGFESGLTNWTLIDFDGDGNNWSQVSAVKPHTGNGNATSASWSQDAGALRPNNWLVSPQIDLSSETGTIMVEYWVGAQDQTWPSEKYKLCVSTSGNAVSDFSTILFEETVTAGNNAEQNYFYRLFNLSQYTGQKIYLAWVHYDCTDMFRINLDDVSVFENTSVDIGIEEISAPNNTSACLLGNAEEVSVVLKNNGGLQLSNFEISYTLNDGSPVTETITETIDGGSTYTYTFSTPLDLSTLGYHSIKVEIPALENEETTSNNSLTKEIRSTDASITVEVDSDAEGGQSWKLYNAAEELVGEHGAYQWNVSTSTKVCVLKDDCYRFEWIGAAETNNSILVSYADDQNNTSSGSGTAGASLNLYGFGQGCPNNDIQLLRLTTTDYALLNENFDVTGTILNKGLDNITSFNIVYKIGETTSEVFTVENLNLTTGSTYNFKHNVAHQFAESGRFDVEVIVSEPNTLTDENENDNSIIKTIVVPKSVVQRKVLLENFTTAQCPNCPAAHDMINGWFTNGLENVIWLAHHAGYYTDSWTIPVNEDLLVFFNDGGATYAPAMMLDRYHFSERNNPGPVFFTGETYAKTLVDQRVAEPAFVNLAIEGEINSSTLDLDLTISGQFTADLSGKDIRLGLYILEDGLTGTQAGATGTYTHDHVVRKALSASFGDENVITSSGEDDTYSKTYESTLNSSWKIDNLTIVAFLAEYNEDVNKRTVLNAASIKAKELLTQTGIDFTSTLNANIYPNPSNGNVKISGVNNAKIEVYNAIGQNVFSLENYMENNEINLSHLNNGVYLIKIYEENQIGLRRIVISK